MKVGIFPARLCRLGIIMTVVLLCGMNNSTGIAEPFSCKVATSMDPDDESWWRKSFRQQWQSLDLNGRTRLIGEWSRCRLHESPLALPYYGWDQFGMALGSLTLADFSRMLTRFSDDSRTQRALVGLSKFLPTDHAKKVFGMTVRSGDEDVRVLSVLKMASRPENSAELCCDSSSWCDKRPPVTLAGEGGSTATTLKKGVCPYYQPQSSFVPDYLPLITDSSEKVRSIVASLLGRHSTEFTGIRSSADAVSLSQVQNTLVAALQDASPLVRKSAAIALLNQGDRRGSSEAVRFLIETAQDGSARNLAGIADAILSGDPAEGGADICGFLLSGKDTYGKDILWDRLEEHGLAQSCVAQLLTQARCNLSALDSEAKKHVPTFTDRDGAISFISDLDKNCRVPFLADTIKERHNKWGVITLLVMGRKVKHPSESIARISKNRLNINLSSG